MTWADVLFWVFPPAALLVVAVWATYKLIDSGRRGIGDSAGDSDSWDEYEDGED